VHQGSCGGAGAEAYFAFTLTATSDVFLATHDTAGVNTILCVRQTNCNGTQVGCNTDADGLVTSRLTLTSLAPGTYNVFVDTVAGVPAGGTVTLDAYITAPGPASERCGNPTFIPAGALNIMGNTCGFTDDYQPVVDSINCFGLFSGNGPTGGELDRVYYFYLPTSRTVTVSGCSVGSYDAALFARRVCTDASAGAQVACDDDACSGSTSFCTSAGYRPTFTTTIGPGLFYLYVDGYLRPANRPCGCGSYTMALTNF
jgi:hypothetical protein